MQNEDEHEDRDEGEGEHVDKGEDGHEDEHEGEVAPEPELTRNVRGVVHTVYTGVAFNHEVCKLVPVNRL